MYGLGLTATGVAALGVGYAVFARLGTAGGTGATSRADDDPMRSLSAAHQGAWGQVRSGGTGARTATPVVAGAATASPASGDGTTVARTWLSGVDAAVISAARAVLSAALRDASTSVADGATLRVLSADGQWLLPLAACHARRDVDAALTDAMVQTAELARWGVWAPVIDQRATIMYDIAGKGRPDEASGAQAAFIRRQPVTYALATPVLVDDIVVGGVTLVRFVVERPFSDAEAAGLRQVAARAAQAIDFPGLASGKVTPRRRRRPGAAAL